MKPNVIPPGKWVFIEPLEYVPVARFKALLTRFEEIESERSRLQKELAKTYKELATYRNLAAKTGG